MSEPMDPDRLRRLFAEAEAALTPLAPPLATITARAARRRSRRLAVMWASGITAAVAVTAVVLTVNFVGARSAPDSSAPAPAVSSPSAIGSKSPVPTPESAPATTPGSASASAPPVASTPDAPTPAASGMRWVSQDFGADHPSLSLQVPAGWTPHHAFVGQTGGTEWVNPADPDQRVAVVLGYCMSCQQPELTRDPTVRTWLTDSAGVLIQPGEAAIRWTSVTDDGQQGYFTDTAHIDDFCLNGDSSNPAWGQTHEPYVALGYVHLAQQPIVEPVEVFAWAPAGVAQTVIGSVTYAPPAYVDYWNARFKYQLDVPASLTAGTPPTNGDGQSFTSSDGQATLLVAGENNVGDAKPGYYSAILPPDAGKLTITQQDVSGPMTVASGTYQDNGQTMIFYTRDFVGPANGCIQFMQWTYPASQKDIYDPQVAHTAATFMAGDLDHVH